MSSSLVIPTSIAYFELYLLVWLLDFVSSGCHNTSTVFHYGIWSCDSMTVICDLLLIPNSNSKNRIDWKKKKRKANKIEFNLCISNNSSIRERNIYKFTIFKSDNFIYIYFLQFNFLLIINYVIIIYYISWY